MGNIKSTKTCEVCAASFMAWNKKSRFCSQRCHGNSRIIPITKERLMAKVDKSQDPLGCWVWRGGKASAGYGHIRSRGTIIQTHRLSWELMNGPIPEGMYVCHRCDNPPCVNPDHLFLGTGADNVNDKMAKGRYRKGAPCRGESNNKAKLTTAQVLQIRKEYQPRVVIMTHLASRFGVCRDTIRKILNRKLWSHI